MLKLLKITLITFIALISLYMAYLVISTKCGLKDLTSERIQMLQNRPNNLEKDIVVDLTMINRNGGMATYAEEVIQYMIKNKPNYRWIILYNTVCENKTFQEFLKKHEQEKKNIIFVNLQLCNDKPIAALLFYYLRSKTFVNVEKAFSMLLSSLPSKFNDVYYRVKQLMLYDKLFIDRHCDLIFSLGTPSFAFGFGIPQVSIIHDIIHIDKPELIPLAYDIATRGYINNFNFSTRLISISNFTKDTILKHFNNIDNKKIEVIRTQMANRLPNIQNSQTSDILKKFNLERNSYFVFASSFWMHKDHVRLVEAFVKLLQKYNIDNNFKLVFMGLYQNEGKEPFITAKRAIELIDTNDINDRVVFTGYTSNEEFNAIMSGALAVVNPSLYEGFGMPVAEAMLLEKPVVCSNVASLPEIGGDAALYFNPYDTDDMAEKLYQVYSDPKLRQHMIEKGKNHVKNFTNKEKMLKDMSDLLDKVMEETANNKYKIDWDFCSLK